MRNGGKLNPSKKSEEHLVVFGRWPGPGWERFAAFMTRQELAAYRIAKPEVQILKALPPTAAEVRDKFWFCEYKVSDHSSQQNILSTADVVSLLQKGSQLHVITGPHATHTKASDSADACWESPGND